MVKPKNLGGGWFRGKHTNFWPTKHGLSKGSIEKLVLDGWLPKKPFLNKKSNIVAIGSCFAEEVNRFLYEKGYNSPESRSAKQNNEWWIASGANNTFALRQLFEWVWLNKQPNDETWHQEDQSVIQRDEAWREKTAEKFSKTDVFILTLGLSEVWYNKETNDVFWRAVPLSQYEKDEQKYGFRVSTVEENKENLHQILNMITKYSNAAVIVTLSPVPLLATFRPVSCITASSVSKSILRAAVDETIRERADDNIYYWPSYEIVKDYVKVPYKEDNRHISPETVNIIMKNFEKYYLIDVVPAVKPNREITKPSVKPNREITKPAAKLTPRDIRRKKLRSLRRRMKK